MLNINLLSAAQLAMLFRRVRGNERAALYAAIVGSARCESVTLSDGAEALSATGRMLASGREVYGWAGAL